MFFLRFRAWLTTFVSAFRLWGMRLRNQLLLDQLFPGRTRALLPLLQHWIVYVALMLVGLYQAGSSLRVAHTRDEWVMAGAQLLVLALLFMSRRGFFFPNRLEPTSMRDQLAWVQSQPKEVQGMFAQLAQPLHQDAWKELKKFAAGLDSLEKIKAKQRKTHLDAVLPVPPNDPPKRQRL